MKRYYILAILLLCLHCSCQPVNKDNSPGTAHDDAIQGSPQQGPDIRALRHKLFSYCTTPADTLDLLEDGYQRYAGPANYPPYMVKAGRLFNERQIHAVVYYSDELGAGLFVYLKRNGAWQPVFADTSERLGAGRTLPELKDWNLDGTRDLCLYQPPAAAMSVIGHYTLWLMQPDGRQLTYIRGFREIENPELDSLSGKIIGSYYYHGERNSEYRIDRDSAVKTKETWDQEEGY